MSRQLLVVLVFLIYACQAQRTNTNLSTCDYYAEQLYGQNNNVTQYRLIQHIVSLAFGGGDFPGSNVSSDITGILYPGSISGTPVDLRPWFNGTIDSTNLNNQPVGIDWLDDGGTQPLYDFLSGQTTEVVFSSQTSNEYRLFTHFFVAFSHIFACSQPKASPFQNSPRLGLAYVHKYMNLNYTDLGYFINQMTLATQHYGFSGQDSQTFQTNMNSMYNVRCAPAVYNPNTGSQLLSLCQAESCPIAAPVADCAAYIDLTPDGTSGNASASTATTAPNFTPSSVSSTSLPSTLLSSSMTSSSSSSSSSSTATPSSTLLPAVSKNTSNSLSGGAIAGIVIGSVAVLILAALAIFFMCGCRNKRTRRHETQPVPEFLQRPGYMSPPPPPMSPVGGHGHNAYFGNGSNPPASVMSKDYISPISSPGPHMSAMSNNSAAVAEMEAVHPTEMPDNTVKYDESQAPRYSTIVDH